MLLLTKITSPRSVCLKDRVRQNQVNKARRGHLRAKREAFSGEIRAGTWQLYCQTLWPQERNENVASGLGLGRRLGGLQPVLDLSGLAEQRNLGFG